MKTLIQHIQEAFKLGDDNFKIGDEKQKYKYFPKDKNELRKIIEERLEKDKNADLNDIDVSNIIYMADLFLDLDPHNIDISKWNVSKVTSMHAMFNGCQNFNSDLSNWNVSKVKDMNYMFFYCKKFEGKGLEDWDVSAVTHMRFMFYKTKIKNLPTWYVKLTKKII